MALGKLLFMSLDRAFTLEPDQQCADEYTARNR